MPSTKPTMQITPEADLYVSRDEFLASVGVTEFFEDTHRDTLEPSTVQPELVLHAEAIVSVDLPEGRTKLICFNPKPATVRSAVSYEGQPIRLMISDANGLFSPRRPQTIVSSMYQNAGNRVLIITTENQE